MDGSRSWKTRDTPPIEVFLVLSFPFSVILSFFSRGDKPGAYTTQQEINLYIVQPIIPGQFPHFPATDTGQAQSPPSSFPSAASMPPVYSLCARARARRRFEGRVRAVNQRMD